VENGWIMKRSVRTPTSADNEEVGEDTNLGW
jgi:hypothetical protein